MKFWQCILNLICHHLSKLVATIDKITSLKMTYSLNGHFTTLVRELVFSSNFPVKSCHANSKFGDAFLPPGSGVDFVDQVQNKP